VTLVLRRAVRFANNHFHYFALLIRRIAVKTGRITKKATTATKIKSEPLVGEELLHGMGEEAVGDDEVVDETDEFV
jgi:hypothetical protein